MAKQTAKKRKEKADIYIRFGIVVIALIFLASFLGPLFIKGSYSEVDLFQMYQKPSAEHLLGTDHLGRDVFLRILYGGRVSLIVGIVSTAIQIVIGVSLGLLAGYFGNWVDFIIMRVIDVLMCFPFLIVAMVIIAMIGPSLENLILMIAILSWMEVARIVRAQVLYLKKSDFVQVSKAIGFSSKKILFEDILPNVLPSILVAATISMGNAILMESSLSFLGLGVKEPMPSWGNILTAAQNMRALESYPWSWLPAGFLIILLVVAVNFLGEGMRIKFHPEEQERREVTEIVADLELLPGTVTGLIGQSGSGKTMTGLSLLGMVPRTVRVTGNVMFKGENWLSFSSEEHEKRRGKEISMIFQEPMRSLNPVYKLGRQVEEVYRRRGLSKSESKEKVLELFRALRLENEEKVYNSYAHELSGGMRQRVQIAIAVAAKPEILVADEPTTAVDASLRRDILQILKELAEKENMAILFITHDLRRMEDFADEIVVMKDGEVIEKQEIHAFFKAPKEAFSRDLLAALPKEENFHGRFFVS